MKMTETLKHQDIEGLIRDAAARLAFDLSDLEVRATYSTLRTSLGLRALRMAQEARRASRFVGVEEFNSSRGLDFYELPRQTLLQQLDAGNGLGQQVCDAILTMLEEQIQKRVALGNEVTLEGLGAIRRYGKQGLALTLDNDLRVPSGQPALSSLPR